MDAVKSESGVLSQADIDRLLANEAEAARFPVFGCDGALLGTTQEVTVDPVDFRNPTLLAEGELRRLRASHQDYVRILASRISTFLRSELGLSLAKFTTQPYDAFIQALRSPTHLSIFRAAPLSGVGILEIPPRLAMAFTNRILGGREQAPEQDLYLTEIEIALLEDVIGIITEEWCKQWKNDSTLEASLVAHETNPRFLQTCPKDTMMLVLAVDAAFGQSVETIQIAVPLFMIEPILKRLQSERIQEAGLQRVARTVNWRTSYDEIAVPVHAEFSVAILTVASLLTLQPGDVLEVPRSALEKTRLCVAGTVQFLGHAGQQDGRAAVHIESKISISSK